MWISTNMLLPIDYSSQILQEDLIQAWIVLAEKYTKTKIDSLSPGVQYVRNVPFISLDSEFKILEKLHHKEYYDELITLYNLPMNEIYVNDESAGLFFSVFDNFRQYQKTEKDMARMILSSIGYFHYLKKEVLEQKIIDMLISSGEYRVEERGKWLFILKLTI